MPPRVGDQADLREGLDERRSFGGEHDVAGEGEVGARARGDAVDRAHDRLLQSAGSRGRSGCSWRATISPRSGPAASPSGITSARSWPAQKARPAPVSRTARIARRPPRPAARAVQLLGHARVEAVQDVRAIERDRQHAVAPLGLDVTRVGMVGESYPWIRPTARPHGSPSRRPDARFQRLPRRPGARPAATAHPMTHAAPPKTRRTPSRPAVDPRFDWRRDRVQRARVARARRRSRRRRTGTGRRCRGSTWCSTSSRRAATTWRRSILGSLLDHPHDARRRLLPVAPAAALARPLDRGCARRARSAAPAASATGATSASCATCRTPTAPSCCRCRATSARSTRRRRAGRRRSSTTATCSATASCDGAIARRARRRGVGGDERLLVGAHDGDDAQAADALLHRGQRPRHLGARATCRRRAANIARNLASFANLFVRDGDGCDPAEAAQLLARVRRSRARRRGSGARAPHRAAPVQPLGPRQPEGLPHRGRDRGRLGARSAAATCATYLVPAFMSAEEWSDARGGGRARRRARRSTRRARARRPIRRTSAASSTPRSRATGDADGVRRADATRSARRSAAPRSRATEGDVVRFAEAVRRTLRARARGEPEGPRVRRGRRRARAACTS